MVAQVFGCGRARRAGAQAASRSHTECGDRRPDVTNALAQTRQPEIVQVCFPSHEVAGACCSSLSRRDLKHEYEFARTVERIRAPLLAALRCTSDVQLPCRSLLSEETHACDERCIEDFAKDHGVQAALLAQGAHPGYACGI